MSDLHSYRFPVPSQIQKIQTVKPKDCRRAHVTQFHDSKIKFPLLQRRKRSLALEPFTTKRPFVKFLQ
jgi:large subunit ribosomal protein L18Ae